MSMANTLSQTRRPGVTDRILPLFVSQIPYVPISPSHAMASLPLVLIAAVIICFCQLPANASERRPRALVLQITKESQLYTVEIRQRTPLQMQRLVIDIEQDYTWVRCDKKRYNSSTYAVVGCSAQLCISYQYSGCGICFRRRAPYPGCNNQTCVVPYRQSLSVELGQDVMVLPSTDGLNPGPLVRIPKLAFACMLFPSLPIRRMDGVSGMSSSTLALPSQLSAAEGFSRKFAMCLPGGNQSGALFFGDGPLVFLPPPGRDLSLGLSHTPFIKNTVYTDDFYIGVQRIDVNGVPLAIDAEKLRIGTRGRGGTKMSTVVHYTQLATPIYNSIVAAFAKQRNLPRVASVAPFNACFNSSAVGSTRVGPAVPAIDLVLQSNATIWRIFGANSMVGVSDKVLCLGFVDAGEDPVTSIVIGTYQMQDNLLQFDLANSTLGFSSSLLFRQTTCSNFNFTTSA